MKRQNDWKEHVVSSIKLLAYIALFIWLASVVVSCKSSEKTTRADVVEAEINRSWYEHSMKNCGRITGHSTVRSDSAVVVTNRKITVYDTSMAILDTVTGMWTAPIAYEIVEGTESNVGSEERIDSASVEDTRAAMERNGKVDSTYVGESVLETSKKTGASPFKPFWWGVILGTLAAIAGYLWVRRKWTFK